MPQNTQDIITKEKLNKYLDVSQKALALAKQNINPEKKDQAREALQMIECYLSDAKHFQKNQDFINAFAAINYAHGWLDCSARLKIFLVKDNRLFAISPE